MNTQTGFSNEILDQYLKIGFRLTKNDDLIYDCTDGIHCVLFRWGGGYVREDFHGEVMCVSELYYHNNTMGYDDEKNDRRVWSHVNILNPFSVLKCLAETTNPDTNILFSKLNSLIGNSINFRKQCK